LRRTDAGISIVALRGCYSGRRSSRKALGFIEEAVMQSYEPPDGPLTTEQRRMADALSQKDIYLIDQALLSNVDLRSRKVARVVVETMEILETEFPELPDVFFSERIRELVRIGLIESFGDLSRMRYSEVRLPDSSRQTEMKPNTYEPPGCQRQQLPVE
jgi:Protein of unknown function